MANEKKRINMLQAKQALFFVFSSQIMNSKMEEAV
jgi:hypothetical protein